LSICLERGLGQVEKGFAIVVECLRRERLKGLADPLVGLVEQRLLRGGKLSGRGGARLRQLPRGCAAHHDHDDAGCHGGSEDRDNDFHG
jgi:hypothetical protein